MTYIKKKPDIKDSSEFPYLGYAGGYIITKFFDSFKKLSFLLDRLETLLLFKDINKLNIDRPIYITGLARAGTTIILEMLNKHPDLVSHQYKHFLMPYIPHWISQTLKNTNFFTQSFERLHKDGIIVTRESPEAVEEIFWQKFFDTVHNESTSNIIDGGISYPKFEKFYQNHIRKLILNQIGARYLAKNNYNITRLEYLLRIFPNSKFLLIIRNPVHQIASLIKQTRLFIKMEQEIPILKEWMRIVGHHEFGHHQVCINVGNAELVRNIRKLWSNKKSYVQGWAYYWASIYKFVADLLDRNRKLKNSTLIVRYDDLCETPAKIIDKILDHTELSAKKFEKVRKFYIERLHKPSYYTPNFSNQELASISEITKDTAARFGISKP